MPSSLRSLRPLRLNLPAYNIYRNGSGDPIGTVDAQTTTYVDNDPSLKADTPYTYTVKAANSAGESAASAAADPVTLASVATLDVRDDNDQQDTTEADGTTPAYLTTGAEDGVTTLDVTATLSNTSAGEQVYWRIMQDGVATQDGYATSGVQFQVTVDVSTIPDYQVLAWAVPQSTATSSLSPRALSAQATTADAPATQPTPRPAIVRGQVPAAPGVQPVNTDQAVQDAKAEDTDTGRKVRALRTKYPNLAPRAVGGFLKEPQGLWGGAIFAYKLNGCPAGLLPVQLVQFHYTFYFDNDESKDFVTLDRGYLELLGADIDFDGAGVINDLLQQNQQLKGFTRVLVTEYIIAGFGKVDTNIVGAATELLDGTFKWKFQGNYYDPANANYIKAMNVGAVSRRSFTTVIDFAKSDVRSYDDSVAQLPLP
jgi:hypothetical protein